MEEFPSLGLVQQRLAHAVPHGLKFHGADHSLEPQQQPVVGVRHVVHAVLIGHQGAEDAAHFQQVMPILVAAGQPAHVHAHDDADVVHGHLGEEALEPVAAVRRRRRARLVVVRQGHAIGRPAEGRGVVGQGVLQGRRLPVVPHLAFGRLADVHDRQSLQVSRLHLDRGQRGHPVPGGGPGGNPREVRPAVGRAGLSAGHAPPPRAEAAAAGASQRFVRASATSGAGGRPASSPTPGRAGRSASGRSGAGGTGRPMRSCMMRLRVRSSGAFGSNRRAQVAPRHRLSANRRRPGKVFHKGYPV